MKGEAAVAILASEGMAQVAVSCQHARRSFIVAPKVFQVWRISSWYCTMLVYHAEFFAWYANALPKDRTKSREGEARRTGAGDASVFSTS